jgi:hypothetical protein
VWGKEQAGIAVPMQDALTWRKMQISWRDEYRPPIGGGKSARNSRYACRMGAMANWLRRPEKN